MAVAAIVFTSNIGKGADLRGRQQTVRYRDSQHVGVALHVQAVLQAQRAEFVFGQLVRQAAAHLVAILRNPFFDNLVIVLIVAIHR